MSPWLLIEWQKAFAQSLSFPVLQELRRGHAAAASHVREHLQRRPGRQQVQSAGEADGAAVQRLLVPPVENWRLVGGRSWSPGWAHPAGPPP